MHHILLFSCVSSPKCRDHVLYNPLVNSSKSLEEPPGKRKRLDLMGEWVATEDNNQENKERESKEKKDDDEDFYGASEEKVRKWE